MSMSTTAFLAFGLYFEEDAPWQLEQLDFEEWTRKYHPEAPSDESFRTYNGFKKMLGVQCQNYGHLDHGHTGAIVASASVREASSQGLAVFSTLEDTAEYECLLTDFCTKMKINLTGLSFQWIVGSFYA